MHILVPIIIIVIVCIQIFFFVKNLKRMREFSNIFADSKSWNLKRNFNTDFVEGILGNGNSIFKSIENSINKYLGNNTGSVIDFSLLKDAIDRHCDSVENDISTQTPIPLYWGLAGTMAGVILGLWDLLSSDAILTLMGSGAGHIDVSAQNAAQGIDSLLSGVAWAMCASICGILLTTFNSILFKQCKLKEEDGKNSFLAWMQSELLPQLPSDTSQALNNLVVNLNKFNDTFAENTSSLGVALSEVNESYRIQAEIIKAVHDMDIMKMAKANVNVLRELQECTVKLGQFNKYLSDIEGYTNAIHRFETMFNEQANRLNVLEEIRDFFMRHKAEIAKTTADADHTLQESLRKIKESTVDDVNDMRACFVKQSNDFKEILEKEKESFEKFIREMQDKFSNQLTYMPHMARQLEEISAIPDKLDKLIEKVEKSNSKLANDVSSALKQAVQSGKGQYQTGDYENGLGVSESTTPVWMKYAGLSALVIIAIACIFNVVVFFVSKDSNMEPSTESEQIIDQPMSSISDSITVSEKLSTPIEAVDSAN